VRFVVEENKMASKNAIPEFESGDRILKPGMRVLVKTARGTNGTGTIKEILWWSNAPCTMTLEMDADTVYAKYPRPGWPPEQERLATTGAFGGEIEEVLTIQ
jgi:hypothetical protein